MKIFPVTRFLEFKHNKTLGEVFVTFYDIFNPDNSSNTAIPY